MGNFADDRHALYAGWVIGVIGVLVRAGLGVDVVTDDGGDYMPLIDLSIDGRYARLAVPLPPEDWELA